MAQLLHKSKGVRLCIRYMHYFSCHMQSVLWMFWHMNELHKYMVHSRDGADVKGYSVWSLLDLYEMFGGYKAHFGLISVHFSDLRRQRQPRLSAYWYSDFLKNNVAIQVENGDATATSPEQI